MLKIILLVLFIIILDIKGSFLWHLQYLITPIRQKVPYTILRKHASFQIFREKTSLISFIIPSPLLTIIIPGKRSYRLFQFFILIQRQGTLLDCFQYKIKQLLHPPDSLHSFFHDALFNLSPLRPKHHPSSLPEPRIGYHPSQPR